MPSLNSAAMGELGVLSGNLGLLRDKFLRLVAFERTADADKPLAEAIKPDAAISGAEGVATTMEEQKRYFDPKLPTALRALIEAFKDPAGAGTAILYGTVQSVQNIISYLGRKLMGTAAKTADGLESAIPKVAVAAILVAMGGAALEISGALPGGWAWLKPLLDAAATILKKGAA